MSDPAEQPEPSIGPDEARSAEATRDVADDEVDAGDVESDLDDLDDLDDGDARRAARRVAEWVVLVTVALAVAFVLRSFVVQSFYIPSTSMAPTLGVGDRVLVNKLAYRFGDPKRGDIIVFEAPPGEGSADVHDLIKRVIGLPGETIEGRDGTVYVDGERIDERWLPDGMQSREFGPVEVPDDSYWVLGDNRLDSRDSTFFKAIPRDSIVGEAFIRIWPLGNFGFI